MNYYALDEALEYIDTGDVSFEILVSNFSHSIHHDNIFIENFEILQEISGEEMIEKLKAFFNKLKEAIKKFFKWAIDKVVNAFKKIYRKIVALNLKKRYNKIAQYSVSEAFAPDEKLVKQGNIIREFRSIDVKLDNIVYCITLDRVMNFIENRDEYHKVPDDKLTAFFIEKYDRTLYTRATLDTFISDIYEDYGKALDNATNIVTGIETQLKDAIEDYSEQLDFYSNKQYYSSTTGYQESRFSIIDLKDNLNKTQNKFEAIQLFINSIYNAQKAFVNYVNIAKNIISKYEK